MQISGNHTGMIIIIVTTLVVVLLILISKVKKYKSEQIKDYQNLSRSCIKSIDIFAKESKRLSDITDCLVKEMQAFKNSEVYKSYKNGNRK